MANIDGSISVRLNPKIIELVREHCEENGAYIENIGEFYDFAVIKELRRKEYRKSKKGKKNTDNED